MSSQEQQLRGAAERASIDLVDLTDFDVQIALSQNNGIQFYEVLSIVTQFMIESFESCFADNPGSRAEFDTIILLERTRRRQLESIERELDSDPSSNGQLVVAELFTAEFKGAALFTRNSTQEPMPASMVDSCQRQAFLQDDALLEKLQQSGAKGLGAPVVDVRAFINPNSRTKSTETDDSSLEIVIVIAIVIACVAFLFLVFAIYWAWRYDKKNRDAYLSNKGSTEDDRTFDAGDSPDAKNSKGGSAKKKKIDDSSQQQNHAAASVPSYPSVIGGDSHADGLYPESVISEDINSSLTQYYQSGLQNYNGTGGRLQDAGSVSSMESYGYSLDGYAPSLATPMPADGNSTIMQMSTAGDASVNMAQTVVTNADSTVGELKESTQKQDP
ncbi:hypothetical protein ACA910_022324 [Epithemia clementina (nom. ined.)]